MTQLEKKDIVGRTLVRVVQAYELLNEYLHWTDNRLVLDSGIVIGFPYEYGQPLCHSDIDDTFGDVVGPQLEKVIGARITEIVRPRKGMEIAEFADEIFIKFDTNYWLSQVHCAPEGIDFGVFVTDRDPEDLDQMIDFWATDDS